MIRIISLFMIFLIAICFAQSNNNDDQILINNLNISKTLLNQLKSDIAKDYKEFVNVVDIINKNDSTSDWVIDTLKNGIYFPFIPEKKAQNVFNKYYDKMRACGCYIFLKNLDLDDKMNIYYDVTLVKMNDAYAVIKLMQTNGLNYDIYNEDVLLQLKKWDEEVGFKFIVIDFDRIEAFMERLPKDLHKFTEDIYKFCPDVIDQGYGSMDAMIDDYKKNKYFWLWWD